MAGKLTMQMKVEKSYRGSSDLQVLEEVRLLRARVEEILQSHKRTEDAVGGVRRDVYSVARALGVESPTQTCRRTISEVSNLAPQVPDELDEPRVAGAPSLRPTAAPSGQEAAPGCAAVMPKPDEAACAQPAAGPGGAGAAAGAVDDAPCPQRLLPRAFGVTRDLSSTTLGVSMTGTKTGRMRAISESYILGIGMSSGGSRPSRRGTRVFHSAPRLPLRPDSGLRMAMDLLGMVLLFYDSVMVPYMIAWEKRLSGPFLVSAWLSLTFWSVDMALSFATCYTKDDVVITDWKKIALNYLRTWFCLDLLIVAVDWASILLEVVFSSRWSSGAVYFKPVRLLKAVRMVRIMAMLRAGRFAQVEDTLMRSARSMGADMYCQFSVGVSKLILVILWLNHMGCCFWWMLVKDSKEMSDTGSSWQQTLEEALEINSLTGDHGLDGYWYVVGLYWSVTAMFSGASTLVPSNSSEAAFALAFVVFGMLFGSTLISSVAAMLVDFQMMRRDQNEKLRSLRQFLQQHEVEPFLSVSIQKQVLERMSAEKRLCDKDVPVLALLSTKLRDTLSCALYAPALTEQPFIRICDYVDDALVKDICSLAVSTRAVNPGEQLFPAHYALEEAFVLKAGAMQYTPERRRGPLREQTDALSQGSGDVVHVGGQQWISELALWSRWATQGLMESVAPSEVLVVSVTGFATVVEARPDMAQIMQDYSTALCNAVESASCDLSDLRSGMGIDEDNVIFAMPQRSRAMMSMPALEAIQRSSGRSVSRQKRYQELEREVHEGRCNLREDGGGRVLRVVHLVALRLVRQDGLLCVKLGEFTGESQEPEPSVPRLPGTKLRKGELPGRALERLLAAELSLAPAAVQAGPGRREVEERPSDTYGVTTKYLRTVFAAALEPQFDDALSPTSLHREPCEGGSSDDQVAGERLHFFVASKNFYAWLSEGDFQMLSAEGDEGLQRIQTWMERYKLLTQGEVAVAI